MRPTKQPASRDEPGEAAKGDKMLHEQNINGRQFTIQWNGPGWYGPQQIQDGEHWTNAVLDTDNVPAWDVSRYGRHLGTLRHFRTVEDWKALS